MSAIPNPQPTRPPLPFLDDLATLFTGTAVVTGVLAVVLLVLAAIGVLRRVGISAQQSVVVIGVAVLASVVTGLLAVFLHG
ncbi:hypothetical protein FRIG_03830 [Frigoribacterium faeni]|uniref:hypothetical protein n=1 Tax=Frigoribacterium faeni TaxID=145483 RepID=UPI001FAD7648|nr:hypothetical protein [Frigoribacterium faeni]MCJ0700271.1 hypothetical protein [Frigoribacterium faeni]